MKLCFHSKKLTENLEGQKQCPEYNFNGVCYNSDKVSDIYEEEQIEELKEVVARKNNELYAKGLSYISFSDKEQMEKFKRKFSWLEEECLEFQTRIEEETKDDMTFNGSISKEQGLVLKRKK